MIKINNLNDKEYFTYLKIVKETLIFILPNFAEYEEHFQQLKVIVGDIRILILQLTNWMIFYYSDVKGEPNQFSLNISNTLQPQLQNYFIRKSDLQGMQIYFKEQQLDKLENLIRNRIFQQQKENVLVRIVENRDMSILIYSYLKRRDMINLELSCFNIRDLFIENNYWYQLYKRKYGLTGFKLDSFSWKNKFLLQMKP
ncbi:unnamed protein product [Paramecium pentaurelia]|uniref:Uncharacterized protein n=1 Tax=Paramecium pentaurelia TaxID=43138 RepID=A0A8S1TCE8_9CILI|nr:unnamed protein product [Paramecium pentaurelia]